MPLEPRRTHEQTQFARQLRAVSPIPERMLWNVLRNSQVAGLRFRRQVPIGAYCVDFVCVSAKLVIELDGTSHEGRQQHDAQRTAVLNKEGLRVFRVTNDDVMSDVESVAIAIAREAGVDVEAWLNGRWKPPARQRSATSIATPEAPPHPNPLPRRRGRGDKISPPNGYIRPTNDSTERAFTVLGTSPLWDAARRCHDALHRNGLAHAIVGGVAVALHGYRRTTADVDVLIRSEDQAAVRRSLEAVGFAWDETVREFRGADGVPIQCLIALEPASQDSSLGVLLPDPSVAEVVTEIEGLSVITLPKLIELKLACGLGDIRRSYRDWADVVELIVARNLDHRFAGLLHKAVRKEYRALVKRARGET